MRFEGSILTVIRRLRNKTVYQDECDADRNRGIRDIEGGPMITGNVKIQEIENMTP